MHFSYVVAGPSSTPTTASATVSTTATTVGPGQVITIGGDRPTTEIPGPHQDPADFYGIVIVALAIAVALVDTRWVFGRRPKQQ